MQFEIVNGLMVYNIQSLHPTTDTGPYLPIPSDDVYANGEKKEEEEWKAHAKRRSIRQKQFKREIKMIVCCTAHTHT